MRQKNYFLSLLMYILIIFAKILHYTIFHDYSKCENKQKKKTLYTILVKTFWNKNNLIFTNSSFLSFLPPSFPFSLHQCPPPSSPLSFVSYLFLSISLCLFPASLYFTVFLIKPAYRLVPHLYLKVSLNEVELYLCITKI